MTELKFGTEPLVYEEKGDILLNYCFSITLYSLDMSAPQQKEAVLAIFDDYRALYGSRMRWAFVQSVSASAWQPVTDANSRRLDQR